MNTPETEVLVYREARAVVVLLCAGDKARQPSDIARAKRYWREHRNANSPLS